ncbi:uncharacterized protein BO96DRAFT_469554 [Aspergillus niger CBS 101883]|uniref:Uncharacterized protein n=2 Tax=Aspergillus niger TaxID=5061 RepID=A2QA70_ASPNC|nr:uncharacterized protein BO96DRAFT_469554 [Aspergillus niger CBS 101883]XP_059599752.1 hypothetical protein An01g10410 [Aspergillus niger]PYH52102.1 hypothetical protein BO96DRAFT_469554 [Aspergillus niger CBS 101883]CAK37222.1 hypothetical protein An01g10410 [Aspergillus niger]
MAKRGELKRFNSLATRDIRRIPIDLRLSVSSLFIARVGCASYGPNHTTTMTI